MLSELLLRPAILVPTICVICFLAFFLRRSRLPDIPIIGAKHGDWFPLLQAKWRNTKNFQAAMLQAHSQYRHQPVLVPVAGEGNIVMLPSEEVKFITDQPDSVLGFSERAFEIFQIDYTFADPTIPRVPLHESLLRTALTPQIGSLIPDLAEEAAWAFETHWGTDTNSWNEVCVFETLRHIVGGVANRVFVGRPFCRDPELVNNGMAFAIDIPLSSTIIKLCWKPLRPILAPLITIPNRIHTWRFRKILLAEIDRRLRDYDARQRDPNDKSLGPEPNDFLQWSIQQAKAHGDPYMWRNQTLADRILVVNFAAIHTTSLTSTQAIFDLVSSTPSCIDELRTEVASVLRAHGGQWNKQALRELVKLDSAIRESVRFSSILSVGLGRAVTAPGGLITPSGVHLPRGTLVSVAAHSIMHDETNYEGAGAYAPFRFSEQRSREGLDHVRRARYALPTTGPEFLVFGHGRHACPGRFFAAAELKLVLAHALLEYDFEPLPSRPDNQWYGITCLPPMTATIKVKRRQKT